MNLTILATAALTLAATAPAHAGHRTTTLAIIGDAPYGADQVVRFPTLIDAINADPLVEGVVHVGDIKNGSSRCDTTYFEQIADRFAELRTPLVYTPGDNEWTDCHRTRAGKLDPLVKLAELRAIFFPTPGVTLGAPRLVFSQGWLPWWHELVENVMWVDARVVFATVNVPGSNNGLVPWFTDDATDALVDDPARRTAEVDRRTDANLAWLVQAFVTAELTRARGVVVFMQADMWDPFATEGYDAIIQVLADLAADFGRPVLLVNGDSHVFTVDQPLLHGDPAHGVTRAVPNLTRITVHGETLPFEYLRLVVDGRSADVFSWERVAVE